MQHLKNEQYMHNEHTLINRRCTGLPQIRWRPTLMKTEQAWMVYTLFLIIITQLCSTIGTSGQLPV